MYTIYKAAGWHGESNDPAIATTDDEREAAMRAGCRQDIGMPGDCNKYDAYAVDEEGNKIERIESFCCDMCGELCEWGNGPLGGMDGKILECPGGAEKHLVTWMCEECSYSYEEEEDD